MSNNGKKERKQRRYSDLDDSQKSIKVFCVESKARNNIIDQENKLRGSFKIITNSVGQKKQTLLAPFDQTTKPSCFKIKKMDSLKEGEKSKSCCNVSSANCNNSGQADRIASGCSSAEDRDSEPKLVKCCEKAEEMDSSFDGMKYHSQRSYFNEMPDELLENVFFQLPLVDLLMSLSLVCKRWYRIISGEKYLSWKKKYYRYKYFFDSRGEVDIMLAEAQLHIPQIFPSQLCR